MRIWCLLANAEDDYKRLSGRSFPQLSDEVELIFVDHAHLRIQTGGELTLCYEGRDLALPDAFWAWTTNTDSRMLERMLVAHGVTSIANLEEQSVARSKVATYDRLAAAGLPIPRTVAFFSEADRDFVAGEFSYPFVIKPDTGFGGEGVVLIHDDAELDAYFAHLKPGIAYMAQEYVATSKGKDVRVVTLYGEPYYALLRQSANRDEFRSNVHLGGSASDYEPDEATRDLCRKAAALFDLQILGLDLLFGENGFVFTEVNSFPGFDKAHAKPAMQAIAKVLGDYLRDATDEND